jgi:hypothetical protein
LSFLTTVNFPKKQKESLIKKYLPLFTAQEFITLVALGTAMVQDFLIGAGVKKDHVSSICEAAAAWKKSK